MLLNYGQPVGGVMQYAYTTDDIEASIQHDVQVLGVGPWFVYGPLKPPQALYRGQPCQLEISLAMAFSGAVMIELIQQHDTGPSVYRETLKRTGAYGFHHVAVVTDRFDAEAARYGGLGYDMAFYDVLKGGRIAYFDTSRHVGGMTELIELTPDLEARQTRVQRASLGWDGREPIRRVSFG